VAGSTALHLTGPARIVIVDDHPVVHDGVAAQLSRSPDLTIVGHARTGAEAVKVCAAERPDVVLLDLRLPDRTAADVVTDMLHVSPRSRVLLFTAFPEHVAVAPTLAAGASGILVKDAGGTAIRDAIHSILRTGTFLPQSPQGTTRSMLISAREYDVLRLVAAGYTNPEIATRLTLSINTVKSYLRSVMTKLGARNRAQLITNARSQGLL
jgi:two-component system, NarL family, nitrate/nitrite response regulator NarL